MELFCILQWQTLISKRTPFQNQSSQMNFLKIIRLVKKIILSSFIIISKHQKPHPKVNYTLTNEWYESVRCLHFISKLKKKYPKKMNRIEGKMNSYKIVNVDVPHQSHN